jgi:hypothetical protein
VAIEARLGRGRKKTYRELHQERTETGCGNTREVDDDVVAVCEGTRQLERKTGEGREGSRGDGNAQVSSSVFDRSIPF